MKSKNDDMLATSGDSNRFIAQLSKFNLTILRFSLLSIPRHDPSSRYSIQISNMKLN